MEACRSCRSRVGREIFLLCTGTPLSWTINMLPASLVKENLIDNANSLCFLLSLALTVLSKLQQAVYQTPCLHFLHLPETSMMGFCALPEPQNRRQPRRTPRNNDHRLMLPIFPIATFSCF